MARKSFKAAHIELRHKTYYAILYVPEDVQEIVGKRKFTKSTQTGDRFLAEERAAAFVLSWKEEISRARKKDDDKLIAEARDLLFHLKRKDLIPGTVEEIISERVEEIKERKDKFTAGNFEDIATGAEKILSDYTEGWVKYEKAKGLKQKTIDQMLTDVTIGFIQFKTTKQLATTYIENWISIMEQNKATPSAICRNLGSYRAFFKFLQQTKEISSSIVNPFVVPDKYKRTKKKISISQNRVESWVPFEEEEVICIYNSAKSSHDNDLANLIKIGAYTGARIEEICSIKCTDINLDLNYINVKESKTEAGIRQIPIHSNIKHLVGVLVSESKDNYLFSGLSKNKYGDRSNAIGKRFGRLKKKLGFDDRHVFHSIRKTLTTKLENAGVAENIAADIVGHEKQTMTYGLYSGGAFIEIKKAAIEKISYDFND